MQQLKNFVAGEWQLAREKRTALIHAVSGATVADASTSGLNFSEILEFGRKVGGPNIRKLTFHDRALRLKALAKYLTERKEELYAVSAFTGATRADSWIDIEGGIGTLFTYSSKARREMPNDTVYVDGAAEQLSKGGTFIGRHICVPLEGVAIHINAFNFPIWGLLEKFAPSFIAGMPSIAKPATITSYLTHRLVELIDQSQILPTGALQLICGSAGDLLEHLDCQDVVSFTGSAQTGTALRSCKAVVQNSVRFNMEADSLNCSILGPNDSPGGEEFELFVREVAKEMTTKAGQKCTAIRRAIVPARFVEAVKKALAERLAKISLGDPAKEGVRMGPLAGRAQVGEVTERVKTLTKECELIYGSPEKFDVIGGDPKVGAFFPALLLYCAKPFERSSPHDVEAFGPVSTILPYDSLDEAIALARLGKGSLVGSIFSADDQVMRKVALGLAPLHGRIHMINRHSAAESTGHGSPMPQMVHGGPGRAGGGEELGGLRSVLHYMLRTALQGSPTTLTAVTGEWVRGAHAHQDRVHPFRKYFDELQIGETLVTHRRTITEADVVGFAAISADHFYAHCDQIAAANSIFGQRVAHGYFVLSAAAGLFVDPAPGPVLANYGLEGLRFIKPVYIGDTIHVRLTVKQKIAREKRENEVAQGVVAWDVEVFNQEDQTVAVYTVLTLVQRTDA